MNEAKTDVNEFLKFHRLLVIGKRGYQPFYFPLQKGSKEPISNGSWKNNRLSVEKAVKLLKAGFNIALAATPNDELCILDRDDQAKWELSKETLSTTSRTRVGNHYFCWTKDKPQKNEKITERTTKANITTGGYGEIRSNWQYIVCAGSFVSSSKEVVEAEKGVSIPENELQNLGKYTVLKESHPSYISYDELPAVFRERVEESIKKQEQKPKIDTFKITRDITSAKRSKLYDLTLEEVLQCNIETARSRFPSLFHDSSTGANTCVSNGLLHCWRHLCFHTPLTCLGVRAGLGSCEMLGKPHKNSSGAQDALDVKDGKTIFQLWDYARKNGIIPENDKIPYAARKYKNLESVRAMIYGGK